MEQAAALPIPGLAQIKRVVVVMFENRSFDHIFGAMPGVNGLFENGALKPECYNLPDPLQPAPSLRISPSPLDPSRPMAHDFTHDFGDGMMPDLFGPTFTVTPAGGQPDDSTVTYSSGFVKGKPTGQVQPVPPVFPATNSGFYSTYNSAKPQGGQALSYFRDGDLRVLSTLAKNFVLCDRWHCDMPGHTLPNRSFFHCASTGNAGIDDTDGVTNTSSATIFDRIDSMTELPPGAGWKMYTPVAESGGTTTFGQLDTRFLNANVQHYPGVPLTEFPTDCQDGKLPFYSFVMCWLPGGHYDPYTDTSMHPNSLMQPGENLLAAIYNTLRNSPCWEDTLLVVTFDENGGLYDHVFPPTTTPPDSDEPVVTQSTRGSCGNSWVLDSQFDFSLLGLRIPALLISPWLAAGVDTHPYQNTSVIRLLLERLNSLYGVSLPPLTRRDATAPDLATAFSTFGQRAMRTDCPGWIEPYAKLPCTDPNTGSDAIPYGDGKLGVWEPPPSTMAAPPVPYIQELMNIYTASLPGHPDSGGKVTRTFATNAEVAAYTDERLEAARRYFQADGNGTTPAAGHA